MNLSIITINYNNAKGLEKTIKSVVSQKFNDFEYIVIDGGSEDNSVDIIKEYADKINYWVSEPDAGIYNAMNKGIKQAKGDYILFINSGDKLYDSSILSNIFSYGLNADIIYGDIKRTFPNGHTDIIKSPECLNIEYFLGNTIPHPSTFIKRNLFIKYGLYREDLRIVADWAFFLKIIVFGRVSTMHIPIVVSIFSMDGISVNNDNKKILEEETEKVFNDYFSTELLNICTNYRKYYNFYNKNIFKHIRSFRAVLNMNFWREYPYRKRLDWIIYLFNKKVRVQTKDPLSIPIIIISYNRLKDLKLLISFLIERKHKNIIIVDNNSTYPPLLDYYKSIEDQVQIKRMNENSGHLVFWLNKELYEEYASGYYIVTDSDIVPNKQLPTDYIDQMIKTLQKHKDITKVGFALDLSDIPDSFNQKQKVLNWEERFWKEEIEKDLFKASIDTTFALYSPRYKYFYKTFYNAIRIAGSYIAKHGGWYIDSNKQTEEDIFYYNNSNNSNSWKLNKDGNLDDVSSLYN